MAFERLGREEQQRLELEVVSKDARLRLTRMLRAATRHENSNISIIKRNQVVNIVRAALGMSVYVLESDVDGMYEPAEHAWHNGELELVMRRPKTIVLVEVLADLIEEGCLDCDDVNKVLGDDGCAVSFDIDMEREVAVSIPSVAEIDEADMSEDHPNIRILVERMDRSLEDGDYSGVVHASASVFETLAKDILATPTVENKSLGQFFDMYRNESKLPVAILDYIQEIFRKRNRTPLAGHGSLAEPKVEKDEAVLLAEMTKAFVRSERLLVEPELESVK